MIRTFLFFIFFWVYQILVIPGLVVVMLLHRFGSKRSSRILACRISQMWARGLLWISGINLRVHGCVSLPYQEAALVVSNHQGDFDIPIILGYYGRPMGLLAKIELRKLFSVSTWMKYIGCVFIDRENKRQSLKAIQEAIELLKSGTSLVVYPEGTRSDGREMKPFKKGSVNIAIRAGVPIIPIAINGSYKMKAKGSIRIIPADVDLYFGDPVYIKDVSSEEQQDMTEKIQKIIQSYLDKKE
ncbi:MAG: lysophospholipid acyltransferase family protein [Chlamydiota bacterium]|nr:lysophospholipid acyltransferase family protein [Chlamydiota bacterium]